MPSKNVIFVRLVCILFSIVLIVLPIFAFNANVEMGIPFGVSIIPWIISGFGVILFVIAIFIKIESPTKPYVSQKASMNHGNEGIDTSRTPMIYGAPTKCPNCGAPLSDEEIEWVGPLKLMCPSCGFTLDAEKRLV